jgi:hypothetical protein
MVKLRSNLSALDSGNISPDTSPLGRFLKLLNKECFYLIHHIVYIFHSRTRKGVYVKFKDGFLFNRLFLISAIIRVSLA